MQVTTTIAATDSHGRARRLPALVAGQLGAPKPIERDQYRAFGVCATCGQRACVDSEIGGTGNCRHCDRKASGGRNARRITIEQPVSLPSEAVSPAPALTARDKRIARQAKADATSRERGLNLVDAGYEVEPLDRAAGVFFVRKPEPGVDEATGEILCEGYVVDVVAQTCECEQFRNSCEWGESVCKHVVGAVLEVRRSCKCLGFRFPGSVATSAAGGVR